MTKENKREQILSALERLLPGRRFHEITLEEVAREAQVGKGTIYLYFHDKDALFAELVCFRLEKLRNEIALLENCCFDELPRAVFELISGYIQHQCNWGGAIGDLAANAARMTSEQHAMVQKYGAAVVEALAKVMHKSRALWTIEQSRSNASFLLWLIDGYTRSKISGSLSLPDREDILTFFMRGAGIIRNKN